MNHKNAKKNSNHSFSWEICLAILLQSSAALPWHNGVLTQKRWKVKMQKCIKWGIEKDPSAPLLLQNTDMNLFTQNPNTNSEKFLYQNPNATSERFLSQCGGWIYFACDDPPLVIRILCIHQRPWLPAHNNSIWQKMPFLMIVGCMLDRILIFATRLRK